MGGASRNKISGLHFRCLDAGGEQLDEFRTVVADGVKRRTGLNEFGVSQKFKPVFCLRRFLEGDLQFGGEVSFALRVAALGNIRTDRGACAQHLLGNDRLLVFAQILVEAHNAERKGLGLLRHYRFGHCFTFLAW